MLFNACGAEAFPAESYARNLIDPLTIEVVPDRDRYDFLDQFLVQSLLSHRASVEEIERLIRDGRGRLSSFYQYDPLLIHLGYLKARAETKVGKQKAARKSLKRTLLAELDRDRFFEAIARGSIHKSEFVSGKLESQKDFEKRYAKERKMVGSDLSKAVLARMIRLYYSGRPTEAGLLREIASASGAIENAHMDSITFWALLCGTDIVGYQPQSRLYKELFEMIESFRHRHYRQALALADGIKLEGEDDSESESLLEPFLKLFRLRMKVLMAVEPDNRTVLDLEALSDQSRSKIKACADSYVYRAIFNQSISLLCRIAEREEIKLFDEISDRNEKDNDKDKEKAPYYLEAAPGDRQRVRELARLLYFIGYKYKLMRRQDRAQLYLTRCLLLYKLYMPAEMQTDTMVDACLYDLAESYLWAKNYDIASVLFEECAKLRVALGRSPVTIVMTITSFGRALMADGRPESATPHLNRALACAIYGACQAVPVEKRDKLADALGIKDDNVGEFVESFCAKPLSLRLALMELCLADSNVGESERATIESAAQTYTDSLVGSKFYDQAIDSAETLLKSKSHGVSPDISSNLWQLAFANSGASRMERSRDLYDRLFREYKKEGIRSKAHWYFSRGLAHDALGEFSKGASDFKHGKRTFARYLKEMDRDLADDFRIDIDKYEDRDYIYWIVEDLANELAVRRKDPPSRCSYTKAYEHGRWPTDRFPLKVFIDRSKESGFGGKLFDVVYAGIRQWLEIENSPVQLVLVEDRKSADIYVERVDNYDFIPPGSAGKAEADYIYTEEKEPSFLNRVHLRIFCDTYNGARLSDHALRHIKTLAAHEFGHGLGLNHSPSGRDIMYWKADTTELSERDRNTLRELYRSQD
ncbi:matrixin family metalloprotease [bacterium]|nr:matrixin family metalloprotease [bacterium]